MEDPKLQKVKLESYDDKNYSSAQIINRTSFCIFLLLTSLISLMKSLIDLFYFNNMNVLVEVYLISTVFILSLIAFLIKSKKQYIDLIVDLLISFLLIESYLQSFLQNIYYLITNILVLHQITFYINKSEFKKFIKYGIKLFIISYFYGRSFFSSNYTFDQVFEIARISFCILYVLFFHYKSLNIEEHIMSNQNQSHQVIKQNQDSHTINLEETIKIQDFSAYQNDQSLAKIIQDQKPLSKNMGQLHKKLDISSQNQAICQSIEINNELLLQQDKHFQRKIDLKKPNKRNLTFFQRSKRDSQRNLTTLLLKQSVKKSLESDILSFLFVGVLMIDYKKKIIYSNDQIESLINNCKGEQILEIIQQLHLPNQEKNQKDNKNNMNNQSNKHIDFSRSQLEQQEEEECCKINEQSLQVNSFMDKSDQRMKNQQILSRKLSSINLNVKNQSNIRQRNTSLLENITVQKQNNSSSESFDSELQDNQESSKFQSSENGVISKLNFFEEEKQIKNRLKKESSSGVTNYGKLVKNGNISECKFLIEALNRSDTTLETIIDILLDKNYWKDFWKRNVIHTDTDICINNSHFQENSGVYFDQNYIVQGNSISFQVNMKSDIKQKERPFYLKLSSFLTQKAYQQKGQNRQKIKMVLLIEVIPLRNILKSLKEQELNNFKNKVISSLSHELRTPLNCSIQMLELLLLSENQNVSTRTLNSAHNFQISEEVKKMFIYPALNSSYLLLSMINDIIDFAQINTGKLSLYFTTFNIRDLIKDCVQLFTLQATIKNLEILVNIDPLIPQLLHSDQNRIKQVLLALLSNAIKFTEKGFIQITAEQHQSDLIRVQVDDTGNGITPEVRSLLFKGFQNSNSIKSSSRQSKLSNNNKNRSLSIQTIKQANLIQNNSSIQKKSQQTLNQRSSQNYRSSIFGEENIEISDNFTRKEINSKLNSMPFGEVEEQNNSQINKSAQQQQQQNAGIGLTIANHLAQGLGGNRSIIVESEVNKGSSFIFFIVNQPTKSKGVKQNQRHTFENTYQAWKTIQSDQNNSLRSIQTSQNHNSFVSRQNETINLELATQEQQILSINYQDKNKVQEEEEDDFDDNQRGLDETEEKYREDINDDRCIYKMEDQSSNRDLVNNLSQQDSCNVIVEKSEQRIPQNPQAMQIVVTNKKFEINLFEDQQVVINEVKNITNKKFQQDIKNQFKQDDRLYSTIDMKRQSNFNSSGSGLDQEIINIQESLRNFIRNSFCTQNAQTINIGQNQSMNQINCNSICKINTSEQGPPISPQFNQMHKRQSSRQRNSFLTHKISNDQNIKKENIKIIKSSNNIPNKDTQLLENVIQELSSEQIQISFTNEKLSVQENATQQKYSPPEKKISSSNENQKKIDLEEEIVNKQKQCQCTQILIVDDNDFNLISLEMRLIKQYNLKVDKANSGFIAINLVQKRLLNYECCQTYKLIFMDIDMPIKNGHQTTKEILSIFSSQNISPPLITACTAYSQDAERKKAQQSGMKFYITKPIDTQQIENVLIQALLINKKNTQ